MYVVYWYIPHLYQHLSKLLLSSPVNGSSQPLLQARSDTMVRRWARSAFSFRSFIIRVRFFQMFKNCFFFPQNYRSFSIYFVRFLTERPFSRSIKKRWFNIIVSSGKKVSFYQQKISFFQECKRSFVFFSLVFE